MLFRSHKPHATHGASGPFGRADGPAGGLSVGAVAPSRPAARGGSGADSWTLHRSLEVSAAVLFPLLFVSPLLLSWQRLSEAGAGWLVVPGALLGLVFGDFVTGLVHWAADTYGGEDMPVIGQSLVKPFRVHHARPLEICEHGVVETVGNTCILAAPLLTLFIVVAASGETSAAAAFAVFTAVVTVGVTVATNQFHKWAHQAAAPRAVRALQRAGIILSPEHHRAHHTAPFESSYAITNGWLNPLLNRTRFFRRLERALRAFGVKPFREARGE
jgi:ubiquitin-conjugating enzyme E2 variant